MSWYILYRGPLSSCNYDCYYCPFAKTTNTRAELVDDTRKLKRFTRWVKQQTNDIGVLFTPWGEALIRQSYKQAIIELSHSPNVFKVAIQTNLTCSLDWIHESNKSALGLWATYHPSIAKRNKFLEKCFYLYENNIRFSVGMVGLKEDFDEIKSMRIALPNEIYLWINAYKDKQGYYSEEDISYLSSIDSLFRYNTIRHPSYNKACRAGDSVFSVDGDGTMRRCHFIKQPIGNIYDSNFKSSLTPRPCVNKTCGCHIGYIHMHDLKLYDIFQDGILERIPKLFPYDSAGAT